jgi:hypothetical protein
VLARRSLTADSLTGGVMRQKAVFAFVALAVAVGVQSALAGIQAPKKRVVALGISSSAFPDMKNPQAMTLEGEMATIGIKDVGVFGFMPVAKQGDDKTMVVTIFDAAAKPATELGKVDVPIGGNAVAAKTKPPFNVKVLSVK